MFVSSTWKLSILLLLLCIAYPNRKEHIFSEMQKDNKYHTSRKSRKSVSKDTNVFKKLSLSFYDRKTIIS